MSVEDVKLCCRRSSSFHEYITSQAERLKASREEEEEGRRKRGKKTQKEQTVEDGDGT